MALSAMISVIIPTLNEARNLPPLLTALRNERAEHEIVVVDGGSDDGTIDIALAMAPPCSMLRPGVGPRFARARDAPVATSCSFSMPTAPFLPAACSVLKTRFRPILT